MAGSQRAGTGGNPGKVGAAFGDARRAFAGPGGKFLVTVPAALALVAGLALGAPALPRQLLRRRLLQVPRRPHRPGRRPLFPAQPEAGSFTSQTWRPLRGRSSPVTPTRC